MRLALQLILTGLVTWFILKAVGLNLDELRATDPAGWEVDWGLLAAAGATLLVAYLYSASLWGLMVRELGGHEMGLVPGLRVFFTANLGRYLPGKLWQIAGLAYLSRAEGVPASTATGAAVLGQGFSLAGATLVGVGVLLRSRGAGDTVGGWAVGILLALVVAFTVPAFLRAFLRLWFRLARADLPDGIRPSAGFGLRWLGLYAFSWVLQGVAFLILAGGLGFRLPALTGVPVYPAAYVLGYVALFAPAGVGVREGVLAGFLQPAIGPAGALGVAVASRLWTTVVEIVLAVSLAGGFLKRGGKGGVRG